MERFTDFLRNNRNAIIGVLVALAIVVLILTINFWRTLLIGVFVGVGFLVGRSFDKGESAMQGAYTFFYRLFHRDR